MAGESDSESLWFDLFAELLGCASRPGAIAAAIEHLTKRIESVESSVSRHRQEARTAARDSTIMQARNYPVNCGSGSKCWVAQQLKLSTEEK